MAAQKHRSPNPRGQGDRLRGALLDAARDLLLELGDQSKLSVRAVTARASSPGLVDPHLSLMLVPSGVSCRAVTVAPNAASTSGANALAAPLAQSTTRCRPARVRPSVASTRLAR